MEWWTGVESEHAQLAQRADSGWATTVDDGADGTVSIAEPQDGDPPVQPTSADVGELMGVVYIPRFGDGWNRNLVQGTELAQLDLAGLGHYVNTQMPGALGNVAIAGHRNGYGQPLGDIDKLQAGDAIVIRTQDYWYVYEYTSYRIVTADDTSVIVDNPEDPGAAPTKRMITLTTCEPKYSTPTHRWIAYGELKYWAKVADGIPAELADTTAGGDVVFAAASSSPNVFVSIGSMTPFFVALLVAYCVLFLLAAAIWRWPALRAVRAWKLGMNDSSGSVAATAMAGGGTGSGGASGSGGRAEGNRRRRRGRPVKPKEPGYGFYSWLLRHQPGPAPVRWLLVILLLLAASAAVMQWLCPWASSTIPFLRAMSNYTVAS
ncbi:class E sortase [Bifidobacterium choloepi]|uniref:class E sortase n=1 Tax=Bifidobacterium choloepi TaxID=2614131 RepID=UPI0038B27F3B